MADFWRPRVAASRRTSFSLNLRKSHNRSESSAWSRRPELSEVLTGWLETWQPRAFEAAESLATAFASAPTAMVPGEVADAVGEQHQAYLERCGLKT